jgi:hypothetical protein
MPCIGNPEKNYDGLSHSQSNAFEICDCSSHQKNLAGRFLASHNKLMKKDGEAERVVSGAVCVEEDEGRRKVVELRYRRL